jgi:hypothetical protein
VLDFPYFRDDASAVVLDAIKDASLARQAAG